MGVIRTKVCDICGQESEMSLEIGRKPTSTGKDRPLKVDLCYTCINAVIDVVKQKRGA